MYLGPEFYEGDDDMALNDFSESKVTIKKDELLVAIRKNRESHATAYAETVEGYRETVLKRLEAATASVRNGGRFDPHEFLNLTVPVSHTKDYDRVIKMLEMSTAGEITCTEKQFSQYVLDEWSWQNEFATSNALYNSKVRNR